MANYSSSPLSQSPYDHNYNAVGLDKINMFISTCEFLDSVCTSVSIADDAAISTPDLAFPMPASRHDQLIGNYQEQPWNSEDVSSNPQNKGRRSQWKLLRWFIQKIDTDYQSLQQYPTQDVPPDLQEWLMHHRQSKEVRKVGLRALVDIQQKNMVINFGEILCAVIVQHAIFDSPSKRNVLEEDVESAFNTWSNISSLSQPERDTLNFVLQRLAMSNKPSYADDRLSPSYNISETRVLGTGARFPDPSSYPLLIPDTQLSDIPGNYGSHDYNVHVPSLNSPLNSIFASDPKDYSGSPLFNPPHTPTSPSPWAPGNSIFSPNVNYSFQPDLSPFSSQQGPEQLYGPTQSFNYLSPENQPGVSDLDQSIPFISFMKFLDGFMNLGDLHRRFSHGIGTTYRANIPVTYNGRATQSEFLMDAERSLFTPIETSQISQDSLVRAIITTTRSLAALGWLRSLEETGDYMVHLSKNVLATKASCRNFARTVLRFVSKTSTREGYNGLVGSRGQLQEQEQGLRSRLDQIENEFNGECNPEPLLRPRSSRPSGGRTLQHEESSRASNYQPTLSSVVSSRYGLDTATEGSSVYEPTTNTTPSLTSTAHCEECGKTFRGKHISSHLSRHRRSHREAGRDMSCPICNKIFHHTRTDNIRTHVKTVHGQVLPENGREYWASLQP
ncbi:uncharacterized protein F4822DRAFT_425843 [Hypoxylon trugodes]|uniref:uncharacterized protein n=1 Tax=Hypoxylon trugodes TaxID=326681 RepID=UPI00219979EC|nr:uncharacterized protein F4822DRAFT_425843 [Hypoxylon trugodes]KAI1392641.1 hypothetical protein F4822DRAFT_425843 [Hypoxylon trugodes]